MKKWRCRVCGYAHEGPTPPEVCPVCGAPAREFEEIREEVTPRSGALSGASAALVVRHMHIFCHLLEEIESGRFPWCCSALCAGGKSTLALHPRQARLRGTGFFEIFPLTAV